MPTRLMIRLVLCAFKRYLRKQGAPRRPANVKITDVKISGRWAEGARRARYPGSGNFIKFIFWGQTRPDFNESPLRGSYVEQERR